MRDYIRTTPATYVTEKFDRRMELVARLEASADRICEFQEQLMDGIDKLKPAEYDRLLDDYHAELVRYDRIDRELEALEEPKKAPKNKDLQRRQNQERRERIKY